MFKEMYWITGDGITLYFISPARPNPCAAGTVQIIITEDDKNSLWTYLFFINHLKLEIALVIPDSNT